MDKEQLRFYIRTRTILEVNPKTIHEELTLAYGPEVVSYSTVQKWSKLFSEGRIEVEDDPRSALDAWFPCQLRKTLTWFVRLLTRTHTLLMMIL